MPLWAEVLLLVNAAMTAAALGIAVRIVRSHAEVHERLKHPFHLHGPVK